ENTYLSPPVDLLTHNTLALSLVKMDRKNEVKRVEVKAMSHNLMDNECRWRKQGDKKKVRMVRVVVVYYTDREGQNTDTVGMECCAEHQENAEEKLIEDNGLRR
ncbi:hypothetical protein ACROYT_G006531, partial [Oculina patagonica]